jgi:hypothetical protein
VTGSIREGDWISWADSGKVYRGEVIQKLYGSYYVRLEDGTQAQAYERAATKTDPPLGNE